MDRTEEKIRFTKLSLDPVFKNFKEGTWESPSGRHRIEVVATYEAVSINVTVFFFEDGTWVRSSTCMIAPELWDVLYEGLKFIKRHEGAY